MNFTAGLHQSHGRIVFYGLEIPVRLLETNKFVYSDNCDHEYSNNTKKNTYKFCPECGTKRMELQIVRPELYITLKNRLIRARVQNPISNDTEIKYYAVMEWYPGDVKIIPSNITKMPAKMDEFRDLMENLGVWKQKRFGLYTLEDPVPLTDFYKNDYLKNTKYSKPAIFVDPDINNEKKTKEEELISELNKQAQINDEEMTEMDKTVAPDLIPKPKKSSEKSIKKSENKNNSQQNNTKQKSENITGTKKNNIYLVDSDNSETNQSDTDTDTNNANVDTNNANVDTNVLEKNKSGRTKFSFSTKNIKTGKK